MAKLWKPQFSPNKQIEKFTVGQDYLIDQKLVKYDCISSIAHVKMLGKINILEKHDEQELIKELYNIIHLNEEGNFNILPEEEDSHTAIENYLTKKLGDLGKKIHTARSRNDQVLTALRLYYKDELDDIKKKIEKLIESIKTFNQKYGDIELPGFTHTRKAMPSSIKLWGNSIIDSMKDNLKLIKISRDLIDQSPLGTAAGYGVPIAIDREFTARLLKFKKIQQNPIYTANSRGKFESTILHALTQIMFDLNKIATDLIIFTMPEFNYFELPKEFLTGSSIMPQKKNPDVLEIMRAKYHIVLSYELQIKNIISNLLSGYNRDLQLTKEPTIKGLQTTNECLSITNLLFDNLKVIKENCRKGLSEEIFATNKVYKIIEKGVPFRDAYEIISKREHHN